MTDTILSMRGITKEFPGVKALSNVNFDVKRGEIHSICGENGAGKSTLMKVLSGVYPYGDYEGSIIFDGEEVQFGSIKDSENKGIAIIHQELALVPYLSIAENLFLGREMPKRGGLIDWNAVNSQAEQLLAKVGLHENVTTRINQIGVGKQQLVEIGKAIAKDTRLLILDEPTNGLDPSARQRMIRLIRDIRDSGRMHVLLCSHLLRDVEEICEEVLILKDGRIVHTSNLQEERSSNKRFVDLETSGDDPGLAEALSGLGCECQAVGSGRFKMVLPEGFQLREIYKVAADRDLPLRRLSFRRDTLEDIFLKAMEA